MKRYLWFAFLLLPTLVFSQRQGQGLPLIRNYTPEEYRSHRQNWAFTQGKDGVMYIANGKGVLVFDGVDWQLIKLPNRGHVRSLATDDDGNIYVGGNNDLGVLLQDERGSRQFVSWLDKIRSNDREFGRVRTTLATTQGIYFQTDNRVFRWKNGKLKVWRFKSAVDRVFWVHDALYAAQFGKGLMRLDASDDFEVVPGGQFAASFPIEFILPFDRQLLIGVRQQGMFLYDGQEFTPFSTEADDYIKKYNAVRAVQYGKDKIALASNMGGGIVLMDVRGRLEHIINEEAGLNNNNVLNVFADRQGALWAGMQEGITRVETNSPFSVFDKRLGLKGVVRSIAEHQNEIFALTSLGLYRMESETGRFAPVEEIRGYGWSTLSVGDQLMVGTGGAGNTFVYQKGKVRQIKHFPSYATSLVQSKFDNQSIFGSIDVGMLWLQAEHEHWREKGRVIDIRGSVQKMIEMAWGEYWLTTKSNGIFRILVPPDASGDWDFSRPVVKQFGSEEGIPVGENGIFKIEDQLFSKSEDDELFRYDPRQEQFVKEQSFGQKFGIYAGLVLPLHCEDGTGKVWLEITQGDDRELALASMQQDGSYAVRRFNLGQTPESFQDPYFKGVFYADQHAIWIGGRNGLLRYNTSFPYDFSVDFNVLIRGVTYRDSLIHFGGSKDKLRWEISAQASDLKFDYAAPFFQVEGTNRYQTMLEGFEEQWSYWTTETRKEYTNLWEGVYTFKVRAKNGFGTVSEAASFHFQILPPWYRSTVAYLLYAILFWAGVFGVVQWRLAKLRKEKSRLEEVVLERTETIRAQADELKTLDRMKSRFFANISHELRTPLTLILAPVEDMLRKPERKDKNKLLFISNNAKRLLKLINQLLDLSKIESGKLSLKASLQDVTLIFEGITMSFESWARQHGIALSFENRAQETLLYVEGEKMEQIIGNLISNAVKCTHQGGRISVVVDNIVIDEKPHLQLTVRDNGIGLSPEQIPHIFERFYQVDDSDTREFEGTGIGLSLTKELVELHGGSIAVESEKSRGSTFRVLLPLGKGHLNEEQVVTIAQTKPAQPEATHEISAAKEEMQEGSEGFKQLVLLVEDNDELRQYTASHLQEEFRIAEAGDGEEGWNLALELIPDLIVSDVMMPKLGGLELCSKLKEDDRTGHIPVILLTAKASVNDKLEGLTLKADDYLIKPFNTRELTIRIKNLIATRKLLQRRFAGKVLFKPEEIAVSSQEQVFLEKLNKVLEVNLGNEHFSIEQLGREMSMSRSQIHRKMQAITNQTPSQFVRKYRLERARMLIEKDVGSISEIAYQVGFSSPAYFSKCFLDEYGHSPKTFKDQQTKGYFE